MYTDNDLLYKNVILLSRLLLVCMWLVSTVVGNYRSSVESYNYSFILSKFFSHKNIGSLCDSCNINCSMTTKAFLKASKKKSPFYILYEFTIDLNNEGQWKCVSVKMIFPYIRILFGRISCQGCIIKGHLEISRVSTSLDFTLKYLFNAN